MKTHAEYMSDARMDPASILSLARNLKDEEECPCGWSWDTDCALECPLRDEPGARTIAPAGNRPGCVFNGAGMSEAQRMFLARTWIAVQLMGMDLETDQ